MADINSSWADNIDTVYVGRTWRSRIAMRNSDNNVGTGEVEDIEIISDGERAIREQMLEETMVYDEQGTPLTPRIRHIPPRVDFIRSE